MRRLRGASISLTRSIRLLAGVMMAMPLLALRPVVAVQVQQIWGERLGHLAMEPELFLSKRAGRTDGKRSATIFFFRGQPANEYLAARWRKILTVGPRGLLSPIYDASIRFPRISVRPKDWDVEHVDLRPLDVVPPRLSFSALEAEQGANLLAHLGLDPGKPYVCLAVRDASYLEALEPSRDWSYHDFRDSSISTSVGLAKTLVGLGYGVVRMGKVVNGYFDVDEPTVVDYANSDLRSDFGDVYLFANCAFCISTSTGMDALAFCFRRPVGMVNLPGFDGLRLGETTKLVTFKHMRDRSSGRRLSLMKQQRLQAMRARRTDELDQYGVILEENSEQELADFGRQMHQLVQAAWEPLPGQLQGEQDFLASVPWEHDMTPAHLHLSHSWFQPQGDVCVE